MAHTQSQLREGLQNYVNNLTVYMEQKEFEVDG